jgi:hypothetical protein
MPLIWASRDSSSRRRRQRKRRILSRVVSSPSLASDRSARRCNSSICRFRYSASCVCCRSISVFSEIGNGVYGNHRKLSYGPWDVVEDGDAPRSRRLTKRGIRIHTEAKAKGVERTGKGVTVFYATKDGKEHEVTVDAGNGKVLHQEVDDEADESDGRDDTQAADNVPDNLYDADHGSDVKEDTD